MAQDDLKNPLRSLFEESTKRRTFLQTMAASGAALTVGCPTSESSPDARADGADATSAIDAGFIPAVTGKYRFQQARLFQRAHAKVDPFTYTNSRGERIHSEFHDIHYDRVLGSGYTNVIVGATQHYLCATSKWPWKNRSGDYVGADGMPQSSVPFASTVLTSGGPASVMIDVTSAYRYLRAENLWCAFLLRTTQALQLTGVLHPTATQSRIALTLEDGTTRTLPLWYTSSTLPGTAYPNAHEDIVEVSPAANGLIEFDRPSAPHGGVRSATLYLEHQGTAALTLELYVVAPERPDMTPILGAAAGYMLDEGLAAHPGVMVTQLVKDSTTIDDILDTANSGDYNNPYNPGGARPLTQRQEAFFDPTLWGQPALSAAETATKLPHRNFGKWVGRTYPENSDGLPSMTVVSSSYARDGFVPLAPGLGAIHLKMPAHAPPDGTTWRADGENGTDVDLWLPYDQIGRVRRIRFRYYLLLGDGWEPRIDSLRYHFVETRSAGSGGVSGSWPESFGYNTVESLRGLSSRPSDNTGKFFGGAQHQANGYFPCYQHPTRIDAEGMPNDTQVVRLLGGGYGASSGGDAGYQGRMLWTGGFYRPLGGPAEGGLTLGLHLYDMQGGRMPPSLSGIRDWDAGSESSFSHHGGLGHLYKDGRWRCVEFEWVHNPNAPYVLPPRGTDYNDAGFASPPTGVLRAWIDGVLASTTPNFGVTRLPKIDWALQEAQGAPFDRGEGSPAYLRPISNVTDEEYLGFASIAGNLYYGGRTPCPVDRHVFINGLVAAVDDTYIGPMRGVSRDNGGIG